VFKLIFFAAIITIEPYQIFGYAISQVDLDHPCISWTDYKAGQFLAWEFDKCRADFLTNRTPDKGIKVPGSGKSIISSSLPLTTFLIAITTLWCDRKTAADDLWKLLEELAEK